MNAQHHRRSVQKSKETQWANMPSGPSDLESVAPTSFSGPAVTPRKKPASAAEVLDPGCRERKDAPSYTGLSSNGIVYVGGNFLTVGRQSALQLFNSTISDHRLGAWRGVQCRRSEFLPGALNLFIIPVREQSS
jgi:hypothetical protein